MSTIGALLAVDARTMEALRRDPAGTARLVGAAGEVSLEKMWHALHFLLTGCAEGGDPPLADAILGGTAIGPDVGHGPARLLDPGRVRAISGALEGIGREELRRRFVPAELARQEIYPMVWDEPEEELLDELAAYFEAMAACYREAAGRGHGMLLSLS